MIIRGVSEAKLQEIAANLDLRLENFRPDGRGYAFRLSPISSRDSYARRSPSGRRLKATCFHGFKLFLGAAFDAGASSVNTVGPEGSRVTIRSGRQFADMLASFKHMELGSLANPATMVSLCDCDDYWDNA